MKKGFTLVEFIVVIIIIGVLATLGLMQYGPARERALDREAQANLRLIIAAARIYRMEIGGYYPAWDTADVNANYRLLLPDPPNPNWNYRTAVNTSVTPSTTCAEAMRTTDNRTWRMWNTDDEPVSGACPP